VPKGQLAGSGDLNRRARCRIASVTRECLLDLELSKAGNVDPIPTFGRFRNGPQHAAHGGHNCQSAPLRTNSNTELYPSQPIGVNVCEVGYSARAPELVLRLGNLE
jgi:hypothetical protein